VCIEAVPQLVRVGCKAGHAEEHAAFRSPLPTPLPPLRKINCTLQNALAEKKSCVVGCDVLRGVGYKSQLKVRVRCKACHAEERAAFRSTHSAVPLRKINCTLQNALVEKGA